MSQTEETSRIGEPKLDRASYTIERARYRYLTRQCELSKASGETDRYADLVRAVRASKQRLTKILEARSR